MSYILDALKKSDQERQENKGPTLQTIQRPQRIIQRDRFKFWLVSILIIFLLLFAVFAAWSLTSAKLTSLENDRNTDKSLLENGNAGIAQEDSNRFSNLGEQNIPENPSADPSATKQADSLNHVTGTNAISADMEVNPTVEYGELPATIQKEIPPLTFSFHVFSDNVERRTIIINKHRMTEGNVVLENLILEEITEKGVVLLWKNKHRYTIDVVENW